MTDAESTVLTNREGRVLVLTLNRPDRGNAIDLAMGVDLARALDEVDDTVGAVLLRGGGKHFSVGGDLAAFADAEEPGAFLSEVADALHDAIRKLDALDVPVVIALHGGIGGAGMSLAGHGDVVVCGRSAKLRPAYLAIGLTPDGGMSWTLPPVLGRARFMDLLMTGGALTADEALSMGVVSRVVDDAEVFETARKLAAQLADGPTRAFGRLKRLVREAPKHSLREHLDAERDGISASADDPEGREGVRSFVERRPPRFRG